MSDVNWWLMALAFVLGLVSTFALTVRRVKREGLIYKALGRGLGVGVADAVLTRNARRSIARRPPSSRAARPQGLHVVAGVRTTSRLSQHR
jgi:uncharacterized membrane protein ArfC